MEKKMTLKECKETCIKMWKELAKNGDSSKPHTTFLNDCACCEYTMQNSENQDKNKDCRICPIEWFPKRGIKVTPYTAQCLILLSPYYNWGTTYSKKMRKIYAKEIVKLAEKIQIKEESSL